MGVGQSVGARLSGQTRSTANYSATCKSLIDTPSVAQNGTCLGLGCCSAELPPGTDFFAVSMEHQNNTGWKTTPCRYAMVVDKSCNFSARDLYGHDLFDRTMASDGVPLVLDFAIRNESCLVGGRLPAACRSSNSVCVNATHGPGYLCKCNDGYEGNPYLHDGCRGTQTCDNLYYVYTSTQSDQLVTTKFWSQSQSSDASRMLLVLNCFAHFSHTQETKYVPIRVMLTNMRK